MPCLRRLARLAAAASLCVLAALSLAALSPAARSLAAAPSSATANDASPPGSALPPSRALPPSAAPIADPPPTVEAVRLTPHAGGVVVRVMATARIGAYGEPRRTGNTVAWTLYDARLADDFEAPAHAGAIERVTTAREGRHLLLRLHLAADAPPVEASAYRDRDSPDLLLHLRPADAPPTRPVASTEGAPASAAEDDARLAAARSRWRLDTVVIDAGHGGKDPGTTGHGLEEKDLVLGVALKLGQYLEDRLGLRVVYTRTGDRFVPLRERGQIANRAGAKLFISIHANATGSRRVSGTETYFLGMHRTETAREVMERENSVIRLEDNAAQRYADFDPTALVRYTMTQSAYLRQSERLATLIEDQFADRVRRNSRGVKQAGFKVLWAASMPAVLVELGFVTNPGEAHFLGSDTGQDYLASALFRAIRAYKQEYEKGMQARPSARSK